MLPWFRRNRIVAVLLFIAIIAVAIAANPERVDRALVFLRLRTAKSLALASESSRGEVSRKLVRTAWRRLHWARVFTFRVAANAPQGDVDDAWVKFTEASEEWNADLMINIQTLAEYYPRSGKREKFEFEIQSRWLGISQQLFDLRYRMPAEPVTRQRLIDDIHARIDTLNNALYEFVLGQPSPRK